MTNLGITTTKATTTARQTAMFTKESPKQSVQDPVKVVQNAKASDIQANGSDGQKLVAAAIAEEDGVFSKDEAALMNSCNFSLKQDVKQLNIYNNKTGTVAIIKYNSLDDFKSEAGKSMIRFVMYMGQNSEVVPNDNPAGGNINADLRSKSLTFDNLDFSHPNHLWFTDQKCKDFIENVKILNCDIRRIIIGKKSKVKNITIGGDTRYHVPILSDMSTELLVHNGANVKITGDAQVYRAK